MTGAWPELVLIAVLVVINALLSGTEIALISLRDPQLARLAERGGTGALVAALARDPNRFLATIQIGITLAGFLASAVAAVSLAEPLLPAFSVFGDAAETVAVVTVTVVLAFITLVLGELVPKRLALQSSERWALAMGRPLHWFAVAMTPVVWLLSVATNAFVRLFGGEPGSGREQIDLEELKDVILASGGISDHQGELLAGAFDVADRTVQELMTPRLDVFTLDASTTVALGLRRLLEEGFSRAPVVIDDHGLDSAIGVVSLADLAAAHPDMTVRDHVKEVQAFPESLSVLVAMRRLQERRHQVGFVVDEFGGIEGIITLEDILEEVVGEIYDEADPLVATPRIDGGDTIVVPGRFPVHDLDEFGIAAPEGEYTTVAGWLLAEIGSVPESGDRIELDGWVVTVARMDGQSITETRFVRSPT